MNAPTKLNAHLWERHPEDYYTEPRFCSERLFQVEKFFGAIHDPACGSGRIIEAAQAAGYRTTSADIVVRSGYCDVVRDFLGPTGLEFDNLVSNVPFKHAERFVELGLQRTRRKIAFLLPARFLWGDKRSRWLAQTPLRRVLMITPRPSMPPGPVIEAGIDPGGGKEDAVWAIWHQGYDGKPELGWMRKDA